MSDDSAVRRANLQMLCKQRGWSPQHLVANVGSTYSYWRDLLNDPRKAFGEKAARRIELALDLHPRGWLDTPHSASDLPSTTAAREPAAPWPKTQRPATSPAPAGSDVAQSHLMRLAHSTMDPPVHLWEHILSHPPAQPFRLQVTDDAMQLDDPPSMRPGDYAFFRPASSAAPGQVVLVADKAGNLYIRKYQAHTPTHWRAVARHPGYAALDSVADHLRIIAVQYGGTWG